MESPNSGRGRGRFSARKRSTVIARSTSQRRSEPSEMPSSTPTAPVAPAATSFTFETPSPSNTRGTRMRTRNVDNVNASPEDAASKGGRSLRKRTRVDYSFDQDEDEQNGEAKPTQSANRSIKKRRTDASSLYGDFEEDPEPTVRQRRTSELAAKPIARRHTHRKSTVEPNTFVADQLDDDVAVQDTIEVGGHSSQQLSTESSQRRNSDASHKEAIHEQQIIQPLVPAANLLVSSPQPVSSPISSIELTDDPEPDIKSEAQEVSIPQIEIKDAGVATLENSEMKKIPEGLPAPDIASINAPSSPIQAVEEESNDPYSRLTPYIPRVSVYYPTLQGTAAAPSTEIDGVAEDTPVEEVLEDPTEMPDDSTPAGSPTAIEDTAANSPAPENGTPDNIPAAISKKQYPYKKLRPAQDFIDFIADYEKLSYGELWARLEHLTGVLETIQNEHNDCRKLLDDEDNAVKYQQEESVFQHRVKLARSKDPNANPLRKDFVIKGIRAPKQDSMIDYAKQQDRVMANAYGFEYDDRDSKIAQQDPIGQRGGIGKGRLRDRPKQTAKAAEAVDEGPVVHGKRTRKAPNLFGVGEVEPASRGSTPVPMLPRKRRARQGAEDNDIPVAVGETPIEESPKKRGRGGRPRKHPISASAVPEDDHILDIDQEAEAQEDTRPFRKRRRRNVDEDDETYTNGTNGQIQSGVATRRRNSRIGFGEIPAGSFYSNASTQPNEDDRPNTSSSTATASTSASTYGLREKRQKRFSLDDDDDGDFEDDEQPKPKRVRRVPKKVQEQDFANITPSNIPGNEPHVTATQRIPKIRVKHANAAAVPSQVTAHPGALASLPPSGESTPAQPTNGGDSLEENKDYGQLTKSEKMSMSMKARWASGSMSNAVAKRRATLAAKKAANQTPIPEGTPEVSLEQQEQQA